MALTIFNWATIVFWLALWAFWFVSALAARKSIGSSWLQGAFVRIAILAIVYLLLQSVTFNAAGSEFDQLFSPSQASFLAGVAGAAICGIGVSFAIWARATLGNNWGMPMTIHEGNELVTSGPYAIVRHPIYAGFLLAALGSVLADGAGWFAVFLAFGIYFTYSAMKEERRMLEQFPKQYPAYMKRTKALIPFVW